LTGPKAGGTKLTIYGNNLGIDSDDVRNGILVAGVQCVGVEEEYEQPNK